MINAQFGAFGDHPVKPLSLGKACGDDDAASGSGLGGINVFYLKLCGFAGQKGEANE